jgi:hypothetical protein
MTALRTLTSGTYVLDFDALYARLWAVADDLGDGSRLYTSEGETALKWLTRTSPELLPGRAGRCRTSTAPQTGSRRAGPRGVGGPGQRAISGS